ncbi:PocR ligand-binding domain-containing protein [Maridesulfovibrio zosterae]|uniref:PocR ligand-binding domain-containing protein n=1 Tax=Maridesulfovibrio zosterae TaxID=82171 RepID=UPI000425BDA4|nr:PocR ligand-binding domain-containing protein [Maridesulfovibrio zosterae]
MKFKTQLLVGNVTILFIVLIGSLYIFKVMSAYLDENEKQAATIELIQITGEIKSTMHAIEADVRNYMLTGKQGYLEPYKKLQNKYKTLTEQAVALSSEVGLDGTTLSEAQTHMNDWYTKEAEPSIADRKRLDMTPEERSKTIDTADGKSGVKVAEVLPPEMLREFQRLFSKMTGIANLIVEKDGTPVDLQSFDEFSSFCFGLIRPNKEGAARCAENDINGGRVAKETGKPYVYECHAGLVDFGVPIIVDGIQIGSWLGGQVLTSKPDYDNFIKIADELGLDHDEMIKAVNEVPVLPREQVDSAADFLQLIANSQSAVGNVNLMWSKIIARLDSGVGKKILDNAQTKVADFVSQLKQRQAQEQKKMDASLKNIKIMLLLGILIIAALSIFIIMFNRKIIANQIGGDPNDIADIAAKIAKGDENISFPDEKEAKGIYLAIIKMHYTLGETFAGMKREQKDAQERALMAQKAQEEADIARHEAETAKQDGMLAAATTMEKIVVRVAQAARGLSTQVNEVSHSSEEQQHLATEASTAMTEMNATVAEVAQNASVAASDAENAREQAISGNTAMSNVEKVIESINKQFAILETELDGLGDRVGDIHSIMNVISDIADQTNLLALNAAIEAARAGDAGRGFAVVADEVRKLAEKTMTATDEVSQAVSAITSATQKNIDHMHNTRTEVENSTTMANEARVVLDNILEISDRNYSQAQNIATASEEQASSTEEISRVIENVNTTSLQTASSMQEAAENVKELAGLTKELEELVQEMKG